MSLSYQTSEKYDMKVYIFGEFHGTEKTCDKLENPPLSSMNISEYLDHVFKNTDKFIDFYFEDAMFNSDIMEGADFLIDILANDFNNCLNPLNRDKCIYKNLRTHFVDVRSYGKIGNSVTEIGKLRKDAAKYDYKIPPEILKTYQQIFDDLSHINSYESFAKYIIVTAFKIPAVKKEIKKSLIPEYIVDIFYDILITTLPDSFSKEDLYHISTTNTVTIKLDRALLWVEAYFVDMYTISRMFKKFRGRNNFPSKPKYIIYYAGNSHAKMARMFLDRLDFKEHLYKSSDIEYSTRCLDMTGIKLDFK